MSSEPKCVLIVDDDDAIRRTVGELLKSEGYRVETATNGQQALAKLKTTRLDAILLDLVMPVMDGRTFLREYHRDPLAVPQRVMLMSADADLQATARVLCVPTFLGKPFDIGVLLDRVEYTLSLPIG